MSTTLNLRNTMNFAASFLKNQPQEVQNMDPAVMVGNMVLSFMLGAPLRWRQNRVEISFAITGAATDYLRSVANFGFIETAWLVDATGNQHPLTGALAVTVNPDAARPQKIAPQFDDNAGNITFRIDSTPDANYTVYGDYQKKATLLTSAASNWGVVPDEFAYIFNWGFLCIMSLLINDSRFPIFENYFIARLLGAQDGLSDQERSIFVGNWMALAGTMTRATGAVNSGVAGRGK